MKLFITCTERYWIDNFHKVDLQYNIHCRYTDESCRYLNLQVFKRKIDHKRKLSKNEKTQTRTSFNRNDDCLFITEVFMILLRRKFIVMYLFRSFDRLLLSICKKKLAFTDSYKDHAKRTKPKSYVHKTMLCLLKLKVACYVH